MTLEKIRAATPEEVESIKAESNLTAQSTVLAMGDLLAVWKNCHELDPVFFKEKNPQRMYKFIWGIENIMRGAGVTQYYFNVPVDDKKYLDAIEHFGGERQSKEPQYRYKVNL